MTTFALSVWPLITLILVLRLPFAHAILISLIGGYLLLPTQGGTNLPLLPTFNKATIPSLTLLLLGLLIYGMRTAGGRKDAAEMALDMPGWLPRSSIAITGLILVFVGAQMTVLTNGDQLVYGSVVLPGMKVYDGFSLALTGFTTLIPLILGRKFFAHPDRQRLLLQALVIAALGLSLPALYEIRMSPQLNRIVYGFDPQAWVQLLRNDGFRPVVFMDHGLQLAIFFAMTAVAAFGLFRYAEARLRAGYLLAGIWLFGTLFLSNSLGALVIATLVLMVVLFSGVRLQLLFAAAIAGMVLTYPMLRSAGLIPTERLVSMAATVSQDRAGSLGFRFRNEDKLLENVAERPLFGWGIFGRARDYTDYGANAVTIDGFWINTLGEVGWVGYVTIMGFLSLPTILLAFSRKAGKIHPTTAILCLVITAALIDLIPNGFLSPVTLLVAGALWGRWELGDRVAIGHEQATDPAPSNDWAFARARPADRDAVPMPSVREGARNQSIYTRQTTPHKRLSKSN